MSVGCCGDKHLTHSHGLHDYFYLMYVVRDFCRAILFLVPFLVLIHCIPLIKVVMMV